MLRRTAFSVAAAAIAAPLLAVGGLALAATRDQPGGPAGPGAPVEAPQRLVPAGNNESTEPGDDDGHDGRTAPASAHPDDATEPGDDHGGPGDDDKNCTDDEPGDDHGGRTLPACPDDDDD